MDIKDFFTKQQQELITSAIINAELNTSGEIRVHICNKCKVSSYDAAVKVFDNLEMYKTEMRNGVLFYLAVQDKKFAIIGDEGINKLVPDDFWDNINNTMTEAFKKGNFTEGLCEGIKMAGIKLKIHFPYKKEDINELTNDISFED
jgi:uncharacterized membrane protein